MGFPDIFSSVLFPHINSAMAGPPKLDQWATFVAGKPVPLHRPSIPSSGPQLDVYMYTPKHTQSHPNTSKYTETQPNTPKLNQIHPNTKTSTSIANFELKARAGLKIYFPW